MPKVKVNGINISYKAYGQGQPLILIMGFSARRTSWLLQARAFKKHFRVITFDNRGVGKTDKPSESYTVKAMADDTIGLMDYLGIDKAHILGVSMGGMIAQELAINHPERVRKLVLGSTYAGGHQMGVTSLEMLKALGFGAGYSEEDIGSINIGKLMTSVISLSFNKRLYRMINVPLSRIYRLFVTRGLIGQLEAILDHNTLDRLRMIEAPTLVITGTEDRVMSPSCSEVLAGMIPNAKLVRVEGGSHALFMEMRGRFNKEVLDFLRDG